MVVSKYFERIGNFVSSVQFNRGQGKLNKQIMETLQNQEAETLHGGVRELPSGLQPRQVGELTFYGGMEPIKCTVIKVHFTADKVTYDLELWLPQPDGAELYTRIYNIDSVFVSAR